MNKKIVLILVAVAIILAGGFVYAKRNGGLQNIIGKTPSQTTGGVIIKPEDPNKTGIPTYPDKPISPAPTSAISVQYLIEHRSALNNKIVKVKGVVVADWTDDSRCRPDITEMLCPQPIIFIADSSSANRDLYSDLRVVLNETDKSYKLGQTVEIKGTVNADTYNVILIKSY